MARPCKYGCGTQLEGFDEENRKYLEAGTGGLHTKERCQEAKTKIQQKNDHGNELTLNVREPGFSSNAEPNRPVEEKKYVDHTLKGQSKVKIFFGNFAPDVEQEYNEFLRLNKIKTQGAQFQISNTDDQSMLFAIALYYEEVK